MAELLESSLTEIDWLTGLKVGVSGDPCNQGWSGAGRRMLDSCENDAVTSAQSAEGTANEYRKPAYSYSSLIYLAIGSSAERRMTLSEIYSWICDRFPYYKTADAGWKVGPHVAQRLHVMLCHVYVLISPRVAMSRNTAPRAPRTPRAPHCE